jgi:hypothetical protein
MLVTLAGHDIFKGRALLLPSTPSDYSNFIVACLTHDIGYVRGVKGRRRWLRCRCRRLQGFLAARIASDAALAPYHVDRSKLFVLERVAQIDELDGPRIARAIECTRFPTRPGATTASTKKGHCCSRRSHRSACDPHYLKCQRPLLRI